MAGGKLSPRQKMISLMYLVFIAMLAMTMGKEVLSSFGFMKEKIEDSNAAREVNLSSYIANLKQKAEDQPEKFGDLYKQASAVQELSNNTFNYLESLKDSIIADVDPEQRTNYEAMSSPDKVDAMFFSGENNTKTGDEFLASINDYRTKVIEMYPTLSGQLSKKRDVNKSDAVLIAKFYFETKLKDI